MSLFVDTSVWSLAFRRDRPESVAEAEELGRALSAGEEVVTTGLVLQELLQGFAGPKAQQKIIEHFADLPFLMPDRDDHIAAAELRNRCRRSGIQIATIDALLAQLCIRYDLAILTTDGDFKLIASRSSLRLWAAP